MYFSISHSLKASKPYSLLVHIYHISTGHKKVLVGCLWVFFVLSSLKNALTFGIILRQKGRKLKQ